MLNLKPLGSYQGMPLLCGTNAPLQQVTTADRGRVVQTGFFPGISYIATSKRPDASEYSVLDFEAAHRAWMTAFLTANGIKPRVRVTPYNVEVNLLESPEADVLAVSNWSGRRATVTVEVDNAPTYRAVVPVTGKRVSQAAKHQRSTRAISFAWCADRPPAGRLSRPFQTSRSPLCRNADRCRWCCSMGTVCGRQCRSNAF